MLVKGESNMLNAKSMRKTNYSFAPKLDAAAQARDSSLTSFCIAVENNSMKNDPKPVKFDYNSR